LSTVSSQCRSVISVTVRRVWLPETGVVQPAKESEVLGTMLAKLCPKNSNALETLGIGICVDSMDESSFRTENGRIKFMGQPTECALLKFASDFGYNFEDVRRSTIGRSEATRSEGKKFDYSSSRKMVCDQLCFI
jgi:magnesium-transporting ATPase (P-type)